MKPITNKRIKTVWMAAIVLLILVYSVGVTQVRKAGQLTPQATVADTTVYNGDSVEVVGTPITDDPWKELELVVNAYYNKEGIVYKGTIKVIDDNNDKEIILEENPFQYAIMGKNFSYRIGSMECVNNNQYLLMADHDNKTIAITKNNTSSKQPNSNPLDLKAFIKAMVQQKVNARVTQLGDEKVLTIDSISAPNIQGYRIYYSPQTHRIHRMLIGMSRFEPLQAGEEEEQQTPLAKSKQPQSNSEEGFTQYYYYLEVNFTAIETMGIQADDFTEKKFIRINNNKIELQPAFKEYAVLNAGD